MVNIEEEIQKIRDRVVKWRKDIELIHDGIVNLKKRNKNEIDVKKDIIYNNKKIIFDKWSNSLYE